MARPRKPPRIGRRPDRAGWWVFDGPVRFSTETENCQEAEAVLASYVAQRDSVGDQPCVNAILDARLAELKASGKARAAITPFYHAALKEHFGAIQPVQITPPLVQRYWTKRQDRPTSLREELLELRVALNWAHRQGWIPAPPYISAPGKRPPRERFLTRKQGKALLDAASSQHLRIFLLLAMTTGARRGAILGLTWDRVDLKRGLVDFTDPARYETKKRRTVVPIGRSVIDALKDARKFARTDHVVEYMGKPVKGVRTAFREAAKAAGMPWATPHILKHSVISWLAEDGFPAEDISDLTATNINTVRRVYRKFSPERLRDAASGLQKGLGFRPRGRKPVHSKSVK